jgi:filamentous hemagglutinin family protein
MPFTWVGSLVGTAGRTVGGVIAGAANAVEDVFGNFGTGSGELLTGNFRASGRSFQDSGKALTILPVDITRTAISGVTGLLQTTGDEATYLVNPAGMKLSQVNPKQRLTIAFGSLDANDSMKSSNCNGCP